MARPPARTRSRVATGSVVDLDRDMRDVLHRRHARQRVPVRAHDERTLRRRRPGGSVLDVASGVGQDTRALAARGALAVAAEPSARMLGWRRLLARSAAGRAASACAAGPTRCPSRTGSFDAVFCKGALDHFDAPRRDGGDGAGDAARRARRAGDRELRFARLPRRARVDRAREEWLGRAPRPVGVTTTCRTTTSPATTSA